MPEKKSLIINHLSGDDILKKVLEKVSIEFPEENLTVFSYLIKSIVSQQLSTKAAKTIYDRLMALPSIDRNDPSSLMAFSVDDLRSVGLSYQKTNYVGNVCQYFLDKNLLDTNWEMFSDEQLIELFTSIKGVGVWTVQMVLMFGLKRPDVFPVLDLGIRQGMSKLYDLDSDLKELTKEINTISEKWSPYRSHGSLAIWRFKDAIKSKD